MGKSKNKKQWNQVQPGCKKPIQLSIPLSINVKFKNTNLVKLEKLKQALSKISIIDNYSIKEFDINHSFFQIHYFGNPKKLKTELSEFDYQLINDQGNWEIKHDWSINFKISF